MKLSEICLKITDGTHGSIIDDKEGSFYLLSCKNIKNGKIVITNIDRRIKYTTFKNLNKRTNLSVNDILITTVGTIGELAIINSHEINYEFQRSVGIIKVDPERIIPKYVFYYLSSNSAKNQINSLIKGAVQKCLFLNDIGRIEIVEKTIFEQQHIVDIIGSIDELIESNNQIISKLLNILNQKVNLLASQTKEFIPLSKIIKEKKERVGTNEVKLLSVVNTGNLILQDEYFDKNIASADMTKYKLIRKFDFAYNPARINIGSIGMLKENYLGAMSPIYVVFEINENYKYYLDFYKSSDYMKKYIEKKSSGSVRQNLPFEEFSTIEIPKINMGLLKEFNSLCDLYYKKINDLKTKTTKLETLKNQYLKKFFG